MWFVADAIMEGKKEKKEEKKEPAARAHKEASSRADKKRPEYPKLLPYLIVAALAAVMLYLIYFLLTNYFSTSFATFKSNYMASPKVAVVVNYRNATQLGYETTCYEGIIQVAARARITSYRLNESTMGFFLVNSTSCTYSASLGYPISVKNATANACLSAVKAEPAIFLNYSSSNSTVITPYRLYVYGNEAYMKSCSIIADLG